MTESLDSRPRRAVWSAVLAGLLHLVALPPYVSSGLVTPAWAWLCLLVLWAAGAAAIVCWRHRGPVLLLVPAAAVGLWFGVLTAGEQLLGWTA